MTKFVKPEYLNSEDILKLNFEDKNLKSSKDAFIGQAADDAVTVVGESRRKEFLQIVKNARKMYMFMERILDSSAASKAIGNFIFISLPVFFFYFQEFIGCCGLAAMMST